VGFFMPGSQPARLYGELAQQWRELAERRRAHFVDLQQSGRWKHYYTEVQFLAEMQEAVRAAETWARIASADKPRMTGRETGGPSGLLSMYENGCCSRHRLPGRLGIAGRGRG
jgi:hypothetical protein